MIHGLSEEAYSFIMSCIMVLTLLIQLYVFFLVQFKSPESMSEFRYFLNIITFWDMLFTCKLVRSSLPNNLLLVFVDMISANFIQGGSAGSVTGWAKHFHPKVQLVLVGDDLSLKMSKYLAEPLFLHGN